MKLGVALMAILIAVVVKGAVMALTAWLLWKLRPALLRAPVPGRWPWVPTEHLAQVRVLLAGLVLFAVSELTCAVEIYLLHESSAFLGGIHSLTSALGMAVFGLGLYLYFNHKLFRYGKLSCLANRICHGCTIETPAGCRFRRALALLAVLVALAAVPALLTPTATLHSDGSRYVLPFDSWNDWFENKVEPWLVAHSEYDPGRSSFYVPESTAVIEWRLLPVAALALALAATALVLRAREALGMKLLVFAAGLLGFAYSQLVLYLGTGDIVFGAFGHEVAELWFLIATAELLRRAFPAPKSVAPAPISPAEAAA